MKASAYKLAERLIQEAGSISGALACLKVAVLRLGNLSLDRGFRHEAPRSVAFERADAYKRVAKVLSSARDRVSRENMIGF